MTEIPLGAGTFTHPKAQLQVDLAALVSVATNIQLLDISLELLLTRDIWVVPSHGFHLSFHISLGDDFPQPVGFASASFLTHLGQMLQEAPLWSQLRLAPLLSISDQSQFGSQRRGIFTLELGRRARMASTTSEQRGFMPDLSSDVLDLRPPIAIPTVSLLSLDIFLKFSNLPGQLRKTRKRNLDRSLRPQILLGCDPCGNLLDFDLDPDLEVCDAFEEQRQTYDVMDEFGDAGYQPLFPSIDHLSSSHDPTAESLILRSASVGSDFHSLEMSSIAHSSQESSTRMPGETMTAQSCGVESNISADWPAIVSLTDTAFRTMLCARPTRTFGVKPVAGNSVTPLSDIVPSVFATGYAQAVSERAPLIPAIAKFLASFLSTTEGATSEDDSEKVKATLQGHLWMTMTNGLRDPEVAKRLKPLRNAPNGGQRRFAVTHAEEMLDDGVATEILEDECLDDESDGLFEDLAQDFLGDVDKGRFDEMPGHSMFDVGDLHEDNEDEQELLFGLSDVAFLDADFEDLEICKSAVLTTDGHGEDRSPDLAGEMLV